MIIACSGPGINRKHVSTEVMACYASRSIKLSLVNLVIKDKVPALECFDSSDNCD